MTRDYVLAAIAMTLWLSYAVNLSPLPPVQAKQYVELMKQGLVNIRTPSPEVAAEPEWGRSAPQRLETEGKINELIENAAAYEATLWMQWIARLGLVLLGISGWALFATRKKFWKPLVIASALLYVCGELLTSSVVYTALLHHWINGSTGFKYLPISMVVSTLYFYFVMPILLIATCAVVLYRNGQLLKHGNSESVL